MSFLQNKSSHLHNTDQLLRKENLLQVFLFALSSNTTQLEPPILEYVVAPSISSSFGILVYPHFPLISSTAVNVGIYHTADKCAAISPF
mgnify:CR=1 FL=1